MLAGVTVVTVIQQATLGLSHASWVDRVKESKA